MERETSGQYLFRVFKPAGCVLALVVMGLMLLTCFTHQHDPVLDYVPAHDAEAYAADATLLAEELTQKLLPYLPACTLRVDGGQVEVTATPENLPALRQTFCEKFDPALFQFTETGG